MRTSQLGFINAASLMAALILLLSLAGWVKRPDGYPGVIAQEVVVIGSSLMRFAFPGFKENGAGILGDDRPHIRLAIPGIKETESNLLLHQALQSRPSIILIEANAYIYDLKHHIPEKVEVVARGTKLLEQIRELSQNLREHLLVAVGIKPKPDIPYEFVRFEQANAEPETLNRPFYAPEERLLQRFPLHIRGPREEEIFLKALKIAKENNIEIVLLATPRAEIIVPYNEENMAVHLEKSYRKMAQRYGLPLFLPDLIWPNDFFIDTGHVNEKGRVRYLQEFKNWWQERS